eukprot:TRINITY_DN26458_c0_g3_i1.p1 TRINITY_DN26458_c0_g3~~TRINITY_DN26458_c0_g3_i1.p1  ORF type:complete len:251 (+),score=35.88 TRINITY_DN26458_c0_g3_i1:59-811(+)
MFIYQGLQQQESALSKIIQNGLNKNKFTAKDLGQKMTQNLEYSTDEFKHFAINSNRIVVFSKSMCPFSKRVKQALNKSFSTEIIEVFELDQLSSRFPDLQEQLQKTSGISTVPQIFIDGCFIGDSEFTVNFVNSGEAQKLLDFNQKTIETYRQQINKYNVVLFVSQNDDVSKAAKEMVKNLSISKPGYTILNLDDSDSDQNKQKCSIQQQVVSQDTFPQLFINGVLVGVGQQITELYKKGQLTTTFNSQT